MKSWSPSFWMYLREMQLTPNTIFSAQTLRLTSHKVMQYRRGENQGPEDLALLYFSFSPLDGSS